MRSLPGISPTAFLVIGSCLILYFLPAILGWKKRNAREICWLNFVIGWSGVGWVIALSCALTKDPPPQVVINQRAVPGLRPVLCKNCGRHSTAATICGVCGQALAA